MRDLADLPWESLDGLTPEATCVMNRFPALCLMALFVSCFTAATALVPRFAAREGSQPGRGDLLSVFLGDSRKLFAQHFFLKADAYFHSGYYPSIFDFKGETKNQGDVHLVSEQHSEGDNPAHGAHEGHEEHEQESKPGKQPEHDHAKSDGEGHDHDHDDELKFLGKASNWIERFGRHFFPSEHSHLDGVAGEEEILPWLRLAAELDPYKAEVYTVAAFWLRSKLGKADEAVQFLREGWSLNPNSHQILCELGKAFAENRHESSKARNILELAIVKWRQAEAGKPVPDLFGLQQVLTALVRLDESEGLWSEGVRHLEILRTVSPNPEKIESLLRDFRSKLPINDR